MHFRSACADFMATHFFRLSEEDRLFIFEAANAIDIRASTFVLVPMHCDEECLRNFLDLLAGQAKNCNAAIIIFFNGDSQRTNAENFRHKQLVAEREIRNARDRFGYSSIYIISKYFASASTMGRVRGLLCDIACILAYAKSIDHPIIVNMDVDTRAISQKYLSSFARMFASDLDLKMCAGEVNYGYKGLEPVAVPDQKHVPELFLFNELIKAIQRCARNGDINFENRIWLEGCSMAFSLAAYCACGGFEFDKKSGEDDAIGRALHRYNPNAFLSSVITEDTIFECDPIFTTSFNPDGWLVTDPRRILQAISLGLPGIEAWADLPFLDNAGAHMNSTELAQRCRIDAAFINASRLKTIRDPQNILERGQLASHLYSLIYRSIKYDRKARNDTQFRRLLEEVGIRLRSGEDIHSDKPQIDWESSGLFMALTEISRHADYS
ncbi:hypothetical protein B0G75_13924 [Paraburkholderia sp. BL18I3N2]|uniref:hypothetical protein n=1 Tax=Paraburkholderia sp. BL18I3N2 TaxID=1938799 RepID=UPI000D060504|nr:hypothetical protein [Paraburkholderia sp. BL18I3N2]PRX19161.1 hypothetical protein B0G75_13924 [Paraburkholderia sp. BL18I3N2]